MNEVRFLAESATHPNIVKLNGTFCVKWRSKSLWLLALELCSGGRLQDHVRVYGQLERASGECASIALLSAVAHLHARRVLHRDIRPQNILLEKLRSLAKKGLRLHRVVFPYVFPDAFPPSKPASPTLWAAQDQCW